MLLVVFIVLITYNEYSYQLPALPFNFPALTLPKLTLNIGDVDVHIRSVGMENTTPPFELLHEDHKSGGTAGGDYLSETGLKPGLDYSAGGSCQSDADCFGPPCPPIGGYCFQ